MKSNGWGRTIPFEQIFDLSGLMPYNNLLKMAIQSPTFACLAGMAGLCLVVFTAPAQGTLPAPDQAAFASGIDDPAASAISASQEHHLDINSQISAPQSLLGTSPEDSMAPQMAPPVNPVQQMNHDRPNWAFQTPDEILGVETSPKAKAAKALAAKIQAAGRFVPNQSALETYTMNRRLAQTGSTNLNNSDAGGSFLDSDTGLFNPQRAAALQNSSAIHSSLFDRMLENGRTSFNNNQPTADAAWTRLFNAPAPSAPTPAQVSEMAAFQQMLQSAAPVAAKSGKSTYGFPTAGPLPDPNLEPAPAGFNQAGGTFAPLASGIGRPKRLAPLPAVTTRALPEAAERPAWAPQPPPWTIKAPQLFVEPVRKF